jgi:hypothetical protein
MTRCRCLRWQRICPCRTPPLRSLVGLFRRSSAGSSAEGMAEGDHRGRGWGLIWQAAAIGASMAPSPRNPLWSTTIWICGRPEGSVGDSASLLGGVLPGLATSLAEVVAERGVIPPVARHKVDDHSHADHPLAGEPEMPDLDV